MIGFKNLSVTVLVVVVMSFSVACARGETSNQKSFKELSTQIDQATVKLLDKYKTTGAAVALIHAGEVVSVKGYGFADNDKGLEVIST